MNKPEPQISSDTPQTVGNPVPIEPAPEPGPPKPIEQPVGPGPGKPLGGAQKGAETGPGKGPGKGKRPGAPPVRPMAKPAQMRRRHWGVLMSFAVLVLLPLALFAAYLWVIADDRYTSTVGFTVRQEEGTSGSDLLGGLANLTGGGGSGDGDILYEFIRSQAIVERIDTRLGLREYYSGFWRSDPVFSLWPDATIEDMHWYWGRAVRVSYDQATGLTELRVLAFDPGMARAIATEIVTESQVMVNSLNDQARTDAIRYATVELEQTQIRLKETREALTEFRTRTQIVDLQADIQARMGVVSNLQQRLAEELVALDDLPAATRNNDPRVIEAQRRIRAIRARITEERNNFANTEVLSTGEDYPTLISEFEGLTVEREFAEQAFRAALATRDSARANAARQSRYLATYVSPTLAESAEYPQRFTLFILAALFACLGWGIVVLVYYSIRDKG